MAARLYSLPPLLNPSSARSLKFIVIVSKQTVLLFETVLKRFLKSSNQRSFGKSAIQRDTVNYMYYNFLSYYCDEYPLFLLCQQKRT